MNRQPSYNDNQRGPSMSYWPPASTYPAVPAADYFHAWHQFGQGLSTPAPVLSMHNDHLEITAKIIMEVAEDVADLADRLWQDKKIPEPTHRALLDIYSILRAQSELQLRSIGSPGLSNTILDRGRSDIMAYAVDRVGFAMYRLAMTAMFNVGHFEWVKHKDAGVLAGMNLLVDVILHDYCGQPAGGDVDARAALQWVNTWAAQTIEANGEEDTPRFDWDRRRRWVVPGGKRCQKFCTDWVTSEEGQRTNMPSGRDGFASESMRRPRDADPASTDNVQMELAALASSISRLQEAVQALQEGQRSGGANQSDPVRSSRKAETTVSNDVHVGVEPRFRPAFDKVGQAGTSDSKSNRDEAKDDRINNASNMNDMQRDGGSNHVRAGPSSTTANHRPAKQDTDGDAESKLAALTSEITRLQVTVQKLLNNSTPANMPHSRKASDASSPGIPTPDTEKADQPSEAADTSSGGKRPSREGQGKGKERASKDANEGGRGFPPLF